MEHPPGVSWSHSRGSAGFQQRDTSCSKPKEPQRFQPLWLCQGVLKFLIKPPRLEDEVAPAIKTQPRLENLIGEI